jgi:hypothetical protein
LLMNHKKFAHKSKSDHPDQSEAQFGSLRTANTFSD